MIFLARLFNLWSSLNNLKAKVDDLDVGKSRLEKNSQVVDNEVVRKESSTY